MAAKGKSKVSAKQRAQIAAGRVAGKTSEQIASEAGLSANTVRKQATDPRTQVLVRQLKIADEAVLARCWKQALNSIERHLESEDTSLVRDARKDLLRYLTAGDPPQIRVEPASDGKGDFTLAQLLATMRSVVNDA